jgi:hypothetical protein
MEGNQMLTRAKKATQPAGKKSTPSTATPENPTPTSHRVLMSPTGQSAIGIGAWGKFAGQPDLPGLVIGLHEQTDKVQGGDLSSVEEMLYGQAMTLQTIFTNLARRAAADEGLVQFQANLTLALKAQAQCRATLEALAEIKHPRSVMFAKQANVTSGPQQINNGILPPSGAPPHARETAGHQNELSGSQHELLEDTRASSTPVRADPLLQAVGAVYRSDNG